MAKAKMIMLGLNSRVNPDFSLTHESGDSFNVFSEKADSDYGSFDKSRLLSSGWTLKQLAFVKKHGTQNFKRSESLKSMKVQTF